VKYLHIRAVKFQDLNIIIFVRPGILSFTNPKYEIIRMCIIPPYTVPSLPCNL
jgi:hypothetical protein